MFTASSLVTTVAVITLLLAVTSILLILRRNRSQPHQFVAESTPSQVAPQTEYPAPGGPAPNRKHRITEGVDRLLHALRAARSGNFTLAEAELQNVASLLRTDPTATLWLSAASGLVHALDANYGIAGREITQTLERMSAQWPNIDGGERTYRHIASLCSEAMSLTPIHKLSMDGAEMALLLEDAHRYNAEEKSGEALACYTRTQEALRRSATLKWHTALQEDIERRRLALLKAIIPRPTEGEDAIPDGTTLATLGSYSEEYARTRSMPHPLNTA